MILTFGTLALAAATAATPAPSPTASAAPLREIGHVRAVTTFCSAFERHFNGAARPMLASDAQASFVGFTLGKLEPDFGARGGELRVYDDRVNLIHYVGELQKLILQAQDELNALRASAKLASDPQTSADTLALASSLQRALDKQRQIAIDSLGVIVALDDVTLGTNDNTSHATPLASVRDIAIVDPLAHLARIRDATGPRASTSLQAQPPGAYDDYKTRTPANERDVRSYLHWQNQLDRIGDAEGDAAARAETIAATCR